MSDRNLVSVEGVCHGDRPWARRHLRPSSLGRMSMARRERPGPKREPVVSPDGDSRRARTERIAVGEQISGSGFGAGLSQARCGSHITPWNPTASRTYLLAAAAPPFSGVTGRPSWMGATCPSVTVTPGRVRRRLRRETLPTGWKVVPPSGDRPSRHPYPEQSIEPFNDTAGDREDRLGDRGDPDRDVSEVDAAGDNEHDVHDIQDDSENDEGDDSHTEHDVHDVQDDSESDDGTDANVRLEQATAESWFEDGLAGRSGRAGMPALHLGVIGCGETAASLHLPHLSSLPDTTITAISSLSSERVEHIGDRYGISHRYQRGSTLITEHRATSASCTASTGGPQRTVHA